MRCGVILPGAGMAPLHLRHRGGAAGAGAFGWMPVKNPGLRAVGLKTRAAVKEGGKVGASFYDLLGISEGGSLEEIKRAYKKMARKYHPDVSPPDLASEYTRRFIELQEAYETLSDPGRRAMYDRDLARGLQFALSSRRRFDQELEEKAAWKNRWQDQLETLKMRSKQRDSMENLSWGARMRQAKG
ncbi:chaperone protein dnaJ 20, chloroplastic-like [Dioscorea cayenensis subsp. rotundata]|uniref:Chaperone protein dnaJ 20, chloroplastic-like n=1 Tax=Dioscorea cayennensis subsp. rotundata TaxID=55577 RepID=A0AB40B9D9_DIOCR|nr:chaperone protein dnaJ 20, chloroplastic-like [Dioscorea cayenensis subsp. rotundata]